MSVSYGAGPRQEAAQGVLSRLSERGRVGNSRAVDPGHEAIMGIGGWRGQDARPGPPSPAWTRDGRFADLVADRPRCLVLFIPEQGDGLVLAQIDIGPLGGAVVVAVLHLDVEFAG